MSEGTETLAQVKRELLDRFEQVDQRFEQVDHRFEHIDQRFEHIDQRFDQVDRRFDEMRGELTTLISATATALEHRIDNKLTRLEDRLERRTAVIAEMAADRAVQRVLGAVYERSAYDAGVVDDKIRALERRLDEHVSNERIHVGPDGDDR